MGDMREVFDQHKQVDKERKITVAARNRQQLKDAGISTDAEQSNGSLRITSSIGIVMFYMTTGRWQFKDTVAERRLVPVSEVSPKWKPQ
ncbi:Uncharacterised protein [Yersinia frederiksenii]|nr:Uncharacterised protein [Yersinia frederiksenii]